MEHVASRINFLPVFFTAESLLQRYTEAFGEKCCQAAEAAEGQTKNDGWKLI